jgi:transposase
MIRLCRNRRGERTWFSGADYIALLGAAHQQLAGPIVFCWDNLNTHISAKTRKLIQARSWLTVIRLPAYTPELNPVEAVCAHLKRSPANLAKTPDQRAQLVKTRLKKMQYRPQLISGFIAKTRLDIKPP